jgi:bifunctional non-homologous end joining protein LigD
MITHPEKIMFPDCGITKGELASYYEAIAPVMLPHLRSRPITMERFHRGIDAPGFFQKDVVKGFPEWLKRVEVPKHGGTVHHPIANDVRSLLWLANQNSITIHVWPSRTPNLYNPDICIFDLDPSNEDDLGTLRAAALRARGWAKDVYFTNDGPTHCCCRRLVVRHVEEETITQASH